jgi:hypothetical protein
MNILTLDFETYFADDYTLSKMTTEAYVRDPRFEAHGAGLRTPEGRLIWVAKPERGDDGFSQCYDWENTAVLCHHAAFDGLILSHHFGIIPGKWLDTMSMAAYLWPSEIKKLDFLSWRFNMPPKSVPYDQIRGKRYGEMSPALQCELADGCLHDCELTYSIFTRMMSGDY